MTMACEKFAAGDKVGSSSTQFSFYLYFLIFLFSFGNFKLFRTEKFNFA
jgi:hypothetical protein